MRSGDNVWSRPMTKEEAAVVRAAKSWANARIIWQGRFDTGGWERFMRAVDRLERACQRLAKKRSAKC